MQFFINFSVDECLDILASINIVMHAAPPSMQYKTKSHEQVVINKYKAV